MDQQQQLVQIEDQQTEQQQQSKNYPSEQIKYKLDNALSQMSILLQQQQNQDTSEQQQKQENNEQKQQTLEEYVQILNEKYLTVLSLLEKEEREFQNLKSCNKDLKSDLAEQIEKIQEKEIEDEKIKETKEYKIKEELLKSQKKQKFEESKKEQSILKSNEQELSEVSEKEQQISLQINQQQQELDALQAKIVLLEKENGENQEKLKTETEDFQKKLNDCKNLSTSYKSKNKEFLNNQAMLQQKTEQFKKAQLLAFQNADISMDFQNRFQELQVKVVHAKKQNSVAQKQFNEQAENSQKLENQLLKTNLQLEEMRQFNEKLKNADFEVEKVNELTVFENSRNWKLKDEQDSLKQQLAKIQEFSKFCEQLGKVDLKEEKEENDNNNQNTEKNTIKKNEINDNNGQEEVLQFNISKEELDQKVQQIEEIVRRRENVQYRQRVEIGTIKKNVQDLLEETKQIQAEKLEAANLKNQLDRRMDYLSGCFDKLDIYTSSISKLKESEQQQQKEVNKEEEKLSSKN